MKLKYEMEIMEVAGEKIAVPVTSGKKERRALLRVNESAGAILELLSEDRSEQELADKMEERFDAPRESIIEGIRSVIEVLRKDGFLIG